MNNSKQCNRCLAVFPLGFFSKRQRKCKSCRAEYDKERYKDPRTRTALRLSKRIRSTANPEAFRAKKRQSLAVKTYYREYRKRNLSAIKFQEKARREVARAIKHGVLIRPESCSSCGKIPIPSATGRKMIQAHHHKGYDFPLDIQWLCSPCHKEAHGCVKYALP